MNSMESMYIFVRIAATQQLATVSKGFFRDANASWIAQTALSFYLPSLPQISVLILIGRSISILMIDSVT